MMDLGTQNLDTAYSFKNLITFGGLLILQAMASTYLDT